MVYFYTLQQTPPDDDFGLLLPDPVTIYMGRDKIENDPLIKYSHPNYLWFHVDNYSSAHVYLMLSKESLGSPHNLSFENLVLHPDILSQLAQFTKANSIKANKIPNITVIYTPVLNLHTDGLMDTGTVSFKNPKLVRRIKVAKRDNAVINRINKTKSEMTTDQFIANEQQLALEISRERKAHDRQQQEQLRSFQHEKLARTDPYADLFSPQTALGRRNEFNGTDWTEDDFM